MNYPCEIIRDLLPLYIDDVCNVETRQVVEKHLEECDGCRKCYEAMKSMDGCMEKEKSEDTKLENSLRKVKSKINQKITRIVLCVTAVALICITGYHLLFVAAIKDVPLDAVSISANVYSVEELIKEQEGQAFDAESVTVSADEGDDSPLVAVSIPEIGGAYINITENTLEKYEFISVASVQSDYFLRNVKNERKDDTIYITEIKTTLLNNKATAFQTNICGLEFGEINRIVFVDNSGSETVLWRR